MPHQVAGVEWLAGTPVILALDLSLTGTGYCRVGETGVIKTGKLRGWPRIDHILIGIESALVSVKVVVLEGYSFGSQGRAVYQIAGLGEIVRYSLWRRGMPYVDVPPGTLKKYATGKGNAGKDEMIAAAIRRFGFEGSDNNEADAYLLWCMARHAYGCSVATVPAVQAEQVQRLEWPALGALSA